MQATTITTGQKNFLHPDERKGERGLKNGQIRSNEITAIRSL